MSVSHEVFASAMDASINRISSLEKGFSELQESVLEMAKRQHTIMGALLVVAEKLEPGLVDPTGTFSVDAGFGSIEVEEDDDN